jgi:hypothetical protein
MLAWNTVAELSTAGGTLVLAVATFVSVRSANRSARVAERSLLNGMRPLLIPARKQDPVEVVTWVDSHRSVIGKGRAAVEIENDILYLSMPVRNVGTGLAILHGWHPRAFDPEQTNIHADPEEFRALSRDLYIAPGDSGFWQGAIRDADDRHREVLFAQVEARVRFIIDVLYGDSDGGQRTITRFAFNPVDEAEWECIASKHWSLDRADPR